MWVLLSTLSIHSYKDVFKQTPEQKFNMDRNFKIYKPKWCAIRKQMYTGAWR